MAASMSNHVRVKLSFNLSELPLHNDDTKNSFDADLHPSWYLIDVASTNSVSLLEQDIIRRFRLPAGVSLFLDGCLIPPKESTHIFRDNDAVTVRCCGHRDGNTLGICEDGLLNLSGDDTRLKKGSEVSSEACLEVSSDVSPHRSNKKKKMKKSSTMDIEQGSPGKDSKPSFEKKKKKKKKSSNESDSEMEPVKKKRKKRKRELKESNESSEEPVSKAKKSKWDITAEDVCASKSPDVEVQTDIRRQMDERIESRCTSLAAEFESLQESDNVESKTQESLPDASEKDEASHDSTKGKRSRRRKRCRTRKQRTNELDVPVKVCEPLLQNSKQMPVRNHQSSHSSHNGTAGERILIPRGRSFGATMLGVEKHIRFNSDDEHDKKDSVSQLVSVKHGEEISKCDEAEMKSTSQPTKLSTHNTPTPSCDQSESPTMCESPGYTVQKLLSIAGYESQSTQAMGKTARNLPTSQLLSQAQVFSRDRKKHKKNSNYSLTKEEQLQSFQSNASVVIQNKSIQEAPDQVLVSNGDVVADGIVNGVKDTVAVAHAADESIALRGDESHDKKSDVPPVDYSIYPGLDGPPRAGDRIAYKVLEMLEDYTPGVSEYKVASVISYNPLSRTVELQLDAVNAGKKIPGRFDVHVEDEDEVLTNTGQEEKHVTLSLSSLLETKLIS